MTMEKLKRCPFCGEKAVVWEWDGGAKVTCGNWTATGKAVHIVGIWAGSMQEAIEIWNQCAGDDK